MQYGTVQYGTVQYGTGSLRYDTPTLLKQMAWRRGRPVVRYKYCTVRTRTVVGTRTIIHARTTRFKTKLGPSFVDRLCFRKKITRYTVLKKFQTQVQPCQRHQLDLLLLNTRGHDVRKTFIILMGKGSLSMG